MKYLDTVEEQEDGVGRRCMASTETSRLSKVASHDGSDEIGRGAFS